MTTTAPTFDIEIDFTTNLSAGLAYYEQVAASGPYVWHRLKETSGTSAADASGNGITGTLAGTYTLNQTTGKPVTGETASRYVLFGGDGSTPGRVDFAGTLLSHDTVSIEAWIYQGTLSGVATDRYAIFNSNLASDGELVLAVQGDGRLLIVAGGNGIITSTSVLISAATWYYVVVTLDGPNKTAKMYRNGVSEAVSVTIYPDSLALVTSPWRWGTDIASADRSSIDRIAEPAVYTQVLHPSTITDHYAARATTPFAGYTWTNVNDYVLWNPGLSRRFGRESQLDDVTPMELTYTLLNSDRRFEIERSASPYYPNVVAGRPTRVRMTQDAVTYDWAFGFIDDFPQQWDTIGKFCVVPIVANCQLERMNQQRIGDRVFLEQLSGNRMTVLLNAAGQPLASRDLDAGAHTMMAQTLENVTAGDHGRQVVRSDRGLFFFDGRGYATFHDGAHRTTDTRSTVSQGTLGSLASEIPYRSPEFHAPSAFVRNEITLRRPGGVDQVAVDNTSIAKHGWRTHQDEILLTTDALTATRAASILADYKDPTLRVRAVTFNPVSTTGWWSHALGVQISDRYTWQFRPEQGESVSRAVFVEGVEDRWVNAEYLSTWFLSLV